MLAAPLSTHRPLRNSTVDLRKHVCRRFSELSKQTIRRACLQLQVQRKSRSCLFTRTWVVAVTYPHFEEQRIWKSGSFIFPSSVIFALLVALGPTQVLLFVRPQCALGWGCGVCSAGRNRGDFTIIIACWNGSSRKGSESGVELGGEHAQGCWRSSQGSHPKEQKRDDMARRTRSASILRCPTAPEASVANVC